MQSNINTNQSFAFADGKITAKTAGMVNITAEINSSISNSIAITIKELPSRIAKFTTTTHYKTEGTAILRETKDGKLLLFEQLDEAEFQTF